MKTTFQLFITALMIGLSGYVNAQVTPHQFSSVFEYERSVGIVAHNNSKGPGYKIKAPDRYGVSYSRVYTVSPKTAVGLGLGIYTYAYEMKKKSYIPLIASFRYYPFDYSQFHLTSRLSYGLIENFGNDYSIGITANYPLKIGKLSITPSVGYEFISNSPTHIRVVTYSEPQNMRIYRLSSTIENKSLFYVHAVAFRLAVNL